jgi:hypothetical protein
MFSVERVSFPKRVIWKENDDFVHPRFYWFERASDPTRADEIYAAHVEGQTITIEAPNSGKLILRLSDGLVDLDQPIRVMVGGRSIFEGTVHRSFAAVLQSLRERKDPDTVATVLLSVSW